jgi:hypothetical protein
VTFRSVEFQVFDKKVVHGDNCAFSCAASHGLEIEVTGIYKNSYDSLNAAVRTPPLCEIYIEAEYKGITLTQPG